MKPTEAITIIESLANGRCPTTGQCLDSTLQRPEVIRALFLATKALERMERAEQKNKALPVHAGRPWDADEDQQLCEEFDARKTISEISVLHQRTKGAIQARLERLGKIMR